MALVDLRVTLRDKMGEWKRGNRALDELLTEMVLVAEAQGARIEFLERRLDANSDFPPEDPEGK